MSTSINFEDFVLCVWDFLSLPIAKFVFSKHASRDSPLLLHKSILKDISSRAFGLEHGDIHHAYELLDELVSNEEGEVSLNTYLHATSKHESVFFGPVESLHRALCHALSGEVFWHRMAARREKLVPGRTVEEIINIPEDEIATLDIAGTMALSKDWS